MDALSDVLRVAHLTGGVFLHADFTAPWCILPVSPNLPPRPGGAVIKGIHTMFYSPKAEELRAFIRDKLGLAGEPT